MPLKEEDDISHQKIESMGMMQKFHPNPSKTVLFSYKNIKDGCNRQWAFEMKEERGKVSHKETLALTEKTCKIIQWALPSLDGALSLTL